MSTLPRPAGEPGPEAVKLIQAIREYALAPAGERADNYTRVRDLHHILTAALDGWHTALAITSDKAIPRWDRLTHVQCAEASNLSRSTVQDHMNIGRALLAKEAA